MKCHHHIALTVALTGLLTTAVATNSKPEVAAKPVSSASGQNHIPMSSLAPMLAKTTPAVVNISVEKEISENTDGAVIMPKRTIKSLAVGSGIIMDAEKGYIVTNAHIVDDQKVMVVTLKDGRRYHAKLIGTDTGFDIAVIQIKAKNLVSMPFGNSNHLKVGDFVVAVGSPFGLSQTVTSGVISALNRATPKIEGFQNFIQTDAPINPGNSGGALINMQGDFIGMNTAILSPSVVGAGNIGIGFAIPSLMVKSVADQLIQYGKITPGILGVIAQNLTPEIADALHLETDKEGVLVTQVMEGSPAKKAGIQEEDVITKINNITMHSAAEIHNLMGITHPDTKITITLLRHGKSMKIDAVVGDPNAEVKHRIIPYVSGLRLQDFSDLEPDSTMINGILVLNVTDTSAGALAGLIPGDLIVRANGKDVGSVKQLIKVASQTNKELLLKVVRGTTNLFLVIQPDQ